MESLARKAVVDTLQAMKQRMDSLYRQSFRSDEEEYFSPGERDEADAWHPQTDVWETDENWILMADLPGITDRGCGNPADYQRYQEFQAIGGRIETETGRTGSRTLFKGIPAAFACHDRWNPG